MIYPILAYGHPNLRKVAQDITPEYPNLKEIIANLYETMYSSSGVGLAAPQVDFSIRVFVIDGEPFGEDDPTLKDFKKTFINAHIIEQSGDAWLFNEGCLSVPNIREDVSRLSSIRITYLDENFQPHDEVYDGVAARVILHEYDHLEGKLFVDHLSSLKKTLLRRKLTDISKGLVKVNYRMKFPNYKRK